MINPTESNSAMALPDTSSDAPAPATSPAPPLPLPQTAPAKPPAILTFGLTKQYGALTALDRLNLQLEPGDVFGFIGPNGAGKSTTMKILAGLLQPTGGSAKILGKAVADNGDFVRRNVGYMPDS
ncbi:MAG: transporter related protein, partial [Phycisphaerales bacterium]|nr:transporter related protein [Phycisphaerales bacterium]